MSTVADPEWADALDSFGPGIAARSEAILSLRTTVSIPSVLALRTLVASLRRLVQSIDWLSAATSVPWLQLAWLLETEALLAASELTGGPAWLPEAIGLLEGVLDAYPIYTAIVDASRIQTKGLEQLRAAVVVCRIHWQAQGVSKKTAISRFCSAVREAQRNPMGAIPATFAVYEDARSPEELADLGEVLARVAHGGMARTWTRDVAPTLKGIKLPQGMPEGESEPQLPSPPEPTEHNPHDSKDDTEVRTPRVRSGSVRLRQSLERDPAPDPAENDLTVDALEIPGTQRGVASTRLAIFRAQQVAWSENSLLLPGHGRVMPEQDLRRLCRFLSDELHRDWDTSNADLVTGLLGLCLHAVTGQTASGLVALRQTSSTQGAPARWTIDLQAGSLQVPALQLEDSFVPTDEQKPWLEEISDSFELPLPTHLAAGIRKQCEAGFPLVVQRAETQEDLVRRAATYAAERLGFRVPYGEVRNAFPCHLYEPTRDIATTMQICGDAFGHSTAPAYYYPPKRSDAARHYLKVVCGLFDEPVPAERVEPSVERAGPKLLVTLEAAKQLASAFGGHVHRGHPDSNDTAKIATIHMDVMNRLAAMLLAIVGHRPAEALFRLLLDDFNLVRGCALFADKKVDLAHMLRIAAVPPTVVRQIRAYISHLAALVEILPVGSPLRARAGHAMSGSGSLLFAIGPTGQPFELTIASWKEQLPESWRVLPLNWGRTHVRTRCGDMGARAELLCVQLGHLEAVGFPFSRASPTVPLAVVEALNPYLERLARDAGWRVRGGLQPAVAPPSPTPRFRRWTSVLTAHRALVREKQREASKHLRAASRQYREAGAAKALQVLKQVAPVVGDAAELLATLPRDQWPKKSAGTLPEFTQKDLEEVQSLIESEAGEDFALWVASANALARTLRRLKHRYDLTGEMPPRWRLAHRLMECPFVPGALVATGQIDTIRQHLIDTVGKPRRQTDPRKDAFAKVALILAVFGYCEQPEEIRALLAARSKAQRSARLTDLALVPWDNGSRQVAGLRGLASIALLWLRENFPDGDIPDVESLDSVLLEFLPEGLARNSKDLLVVLCETVGVSNRIELSPAARMALDPVGGCCSASVADQLAMLDGDPVGTIIHQASAVAEPTVQKVGAPDAERVATRALRADYLSLFPLLPDGKTITQLPRTQALIPSAQANTKPARHQVTAELDLFLSDTRIHPTARMLGFWTHDMLVNGTPQSPNPANATVRTYLSQVGSFLSVATNSSLADLDDVELEQLYDDLVESKGDATAKARAAREVLHFHYVVTPVFGLPSIDDAALRAWLPMAERSADAQLIVPQERDQAVLKAIERAGAAAPHADGSSIADQRLYRQATALLTITAYTGVRAGEPLGCLNRDLRLSPDTARFRVVGNRNRRLKTTFSRRYVDFSPAMPEPARDFLQSWHAAESGRHAPHLQRRSYAFATVESHNDMEAKQLVRALGGDLLAQVTGRGSEKIHRLRHLAGFEALVRGGLLSPNDSQALVDLCGAVREPPDGVILPRDLHRCTDGLGHVDPSRTVRSYFHMPWLARSRSDARLGSFVDRHGAAMALGISDSGADRISQRGKPRSDVDAWMSRLVVPRIPPAAPEAQAEPVRRGLSVLRVKDIATICGLIDRTQSREKAAMAVGGTIDDVQMLERASRQFSLRAGRSTWRLRDEPRADTPPHRLRKLRSMDCLEVLWHAIDTDQDGATAQTILAITHACFAYMKPTHGKDIVLPEDEADMLRGLLESLKLRCVPTDTPPPSTTLQILRVARPGERTTPRYAGWALKRVLGIVFLWTRHRTARIAAQGRR